MRGDCIFMFQQRRGVVRINFERAPVAAPSLAVDGPARAIRGHGERLQRQAVRHCDPRANFFTNRVCGPWNALPPHVLAADSLNSFKNRYDERHTSN